MEREADRCRLWEHSWALEMAGEPTTVPFVVYIDVTDTTLYVVKYVLNCFNTLETVTTASLGWCPVEQEDQSGATQTRGQKSWRDTADQTLCTGLAAAANMDR